MKIVIVNNVSLNGEKFVEQNNLLKQSAKNIGVEVEFFTNTQIFTMLSCDGLNIKTKLVADAIMFYDKDVLLCQILENLGYKVFNSSRAIEICDSKALMYQNLAKHKINIPKTINLPLVFFYKKDYFVDFVDYAIKSLGLPLVVKEWYGSWGQQVYLCKTKQDIFDILDKTNGKQLVFQEFIKESQGQDIRINVVGNKCVAAMKRKSNNGFVANISAGGTMENYVPTKQEEQLAIKATKALGLNFAGVDIFVKTKNPIVCEVNSNAHLVNIYKATNVNVAQKILEEIKNLAKDDKNKI